MDGDAQPVEMAGKDFMDIFYWDLSHLSPVERAPGLEGYKTDNQWVLLPLDR